MRAESALLVERSRLHAIREIGALPFFPALLSTAVLIGFRDAMTGPYLTLFAVERAHLGPLNLGLFLTVRAAGAILFAMIFGAWFDRRPGVAPLLVSLVTGIVGYALLSTTTAFVPLLLVAALPLGMSAAAFPLLFALAKVQVADRDRMTGERGIATLRASFSAAWGIGPALGAIAVERCGYPGLFWMSCLFSLLSLLPFGLTGLRSQARPLPAQSTGSRRLEPAVWLAASSLALFSMAIGVGSVALPLVVTTDLGGGTGAVGLSYSVCALLEVPVMMAIAMRPAVFLGYRGMALGFAALCAYFAAVAFAPTIVAVIASQVLRAVGIGLVSCIGISYLQDLMPGRVGAAAALYANTGQIGALLAGVSAGGWAALFGYHSLFFACVGLSFGGWLLLDLGRRVRQPA